MSSEDAHPRAIGQLGIVIKVILEGHIVEIGLEVIGLPCADDIMDCCLFLEGEGLTRNGGRKHSDGIAIVAIVDLVTSIAIRTILSRKSSEVGVP